VFVRIASHVVRRWLPAILLAVPVSAQAQTQTNYLTLEWTAPGDDGTTGRATRYEMRYSTVAPSPTDTTGWWTDSGTTPVTGLPYPSTSGATDSVRVQGLSAGQTYYFVLRAYDEVNNESGFSNVASGIPNTCTVPSVAPQGFGVTDDSGASLLSWSGTPDASAVGLQVLRGIGAGALSLLTTLSPGDTSYRDTNVGFGTYRYQVRWVSDCGNGPSTSAASITFTAPVVPEGPAASVQARPNPSNGPVSFVVTVPGTASQNVTLRLFDFTGRLMGVVAQGSYPPGASTIAWSRTSASGDPVAPGYYELIGEIGPTRVRDRLVLLP
jgi:fibronectin type III domain protein